MPTKRLLFDKEETYSLRGLCMIAILVHHLYLWTASRFRVRERRELKKSSHDVTCSR